MSRGRGRPRPLAILGAAAALAAFGTCRPAIDVDAAVRDIRERYGVTVEHEIGPDFLPAAWTDPPASVAAESITRRELARMLTLLPGWLDKYPASVLRENLRALRLCGRFIMYGVGAAGTATADIVYLANEGEREGYDDRFLEATFHHELSSLLMYNRHFPIFDWIEANPDGFEYMTDWGEYLEVVESRRRLDGNESLYAEGLLAEYARTNLENDMNIYAEVVFGEPERMKELVERYPAVRAKYEVFKSFYMSITPEFEAWFARIG